MLPHTTLEPRDDPTFLAVIDRIVGSLVLRDRPQGVHLVHVDNWFGPKWLRYSGRGVVAFPMGYATNRVVALDDHYQDKLTFPPFTRNRIVSEHYFARTNKGEYEEQCPAHLVHRRRWRWREQKLHRRVADFGASGLFVWYSSGTVGNDRASLLVYGSIGENACAWYAGFLLREAWQIEHVKGIDPRRASDTDLRRHRRRRAMKRVEVGTVEAASPLVLADALESGASE